MYSVYARQFTMTHSHKQATRKSKTRVKIIGYNGNSVIFFRFQREAAASSCSLRRASMLWWWSTKQSRMVMTGFALVLLADRLPNRKVKINKNRTSIEQYICLWFQASFAVNVLCSSWCSAHDKYDATTYVLPVFSRVCQELQRIGEQRPNCQVQVHAT